MRIRTLRFSKTTIPHIVRSPRRSKTLVCPPVGARNLQDLVIFWVADRNFARFEHPYRKIGKNVPPPPSPYFPPRPPKLFFTFPRRRPRGMKTDNGLPRPPNSPPRPQPRSPLRSHRVCPPPHPPAGSFFLLCLPWPRFPQGAQAGIPQNDPNPALALAAPPADFFLFPPGNRPLTPPQKKAPLFVCFFFCRFIPPSPSFFFFVFFFFRRRRARPRCSAPSGERLPKLGRGPFEFFFSRCGLKDGWKIASP